MFLIFSMEHRDIEQVKRRPVKNGVWSPQCTVSLLVNTIVNYSTIAIQIQFTTRLIMSLIMY